MHRPVTRCVGVTGWSTTGPSVDRLTDGQGASGGGVCVCIVSAIANAGLLVLSGMLQIIVFELAVVILAISNLAVDLGSRLAGAALAALFVIWGIHQGLAAPVLPGL